MKFPKDFLFGSATAAHQIEGGNFNSDWYEWEKKPSNIIDGSTSEVAADSWNNWDKDVQLLKETNQNAYRFSFEWAKIEPKEGKFNQAVIESYRQKLEMLKQNNIKMMATIFHFTLPLWVAKKGGVTNRKIIFYFTRFAKKLTVEYGDLVDFWAILNEPNVYTLHGYVTGMWNPGIKSNLLAFKAWCNLLACYKSAFDVIKEVKTNTKVGIAINIAAYEPVQDTLLNRLFVKITKNIGHELFIRSIIKRSDFLGINYYMKFRLQIKKPHAIQVGDTKSDFDWGIYPEGLYEVLKEQTKWKKPIFITENGISDANDRLRPKFLEDTFKQISRALKEKMPVIGYFYWTLIDNFEWAAGYTQKFGLFTIDRKARKSAQVYKEIIKKYSSST